MNKDPAIEKHIATIELAKILCGKPCDICKFYGQTQKCMPVYNAEKIANAGYRKASEVALEVIGDIESVLDESKYEAIAMIWKVKQMLAELKNKYTEDGE